MIERPKLVLGVILALVLAFSLAGISYYFPSVHDQLEIFPELPIVKNGGTVPTYVVRVPVALSNITITSDGYVVPQNAPIQRIGQLYTITDDIINQTIIIQRSNIVVDGKNYKIQGALNAAEAVSIQNMVNVTLKNLEITNFWCGISVTNCSGITIKQNMLNNIGSRAIYCNSCINCLLSENVLDSVSSAIEIATLSGLSASENNTVTRNVVTTAAQGIVIDGHFSKISENNLTNVYISIGANCNQTTISQNIVLNGIDGISITGSYCTIYRNNVKNCSETGLTINRGTHNTFYENNILNSKYALLIRNNADTWTITNNKFYHNNFINNTNNVNIESPIHPNYWDNGSEGNYWSNYNGTDNNSDGTGDTSYVIATSNIDNYPLMSPHKNAAIHQTNQLLFVILGIIGLAIFISIIFGIVLFTKNNAQSVRTPTKCKFK